jgi:hypothetical protein
MVVSGMLSDGWNNTTEPKIINYFLVDAAVAAETYGLTSEDANMVHPEWIGYNSGLRAADWHKLFEASPDDGRSKLTWRDRFAHRPAGTNYYNFFSSGEDVLDIHMANDYPTVPDIVTSGIGRYAWALQEKLKGRMNSNIVLGSFYGGWGFNIADYYREIPSQDGPPERVRLLPVDANQIFADNPNLLRTMPFFKRGPDDNNLFSEPTGSSHAAQFRNRLLAEAFPALTLAAGKATVNALGLTGHNFDMQNIFKNGWPRQDQRWLHNDAREVSYLYVYKLFDKFVSIGGLQ